MLRFVCRCFQFYNCRITSNLIESMRTNLFWKIRESAARVSATFEYSAQKHEKYKSIRSLLHTVCWIFNLQLEWNKVNYPFWSIRLYSTSFSFIRSLLQFVAWIVYYFPVNIWLLGNGSSSRRLLWAGMQQLYSWSVPGRYTPPSSTQFRTKSLQSERVSEVRDQGNSAREDSGVSIHVRACLWACRAI